MPDLLPCVEIEAPNPADSAVVWLHGLGADGHDFEPIVPMLGCPNTRFVFPHAPRIPVTLNAGLVMRAWYDIKGLERTSDREDEPQIRASRDLVEALVERERARGIPSDRIVLAGFSQGGAMALFTSVRLAEPLAGVMVLSGYPLLADFHAAEALSANRRTPMLFCHGRFDPLVQLAWGKAAFELARDWSEAEVQWHEFPIAHEVSVPEIELCAAWLRERLTVG